MAQVERRLEIAAPAAEVWETVADFSAVGRYSPYVEVCELEGPEGVGQLRKLTLVNGTLTVSRCEAVDHEARSTTYRILETKLPLTDYTSTQTVNELGADRCEVVWASNFEPSGASLAEAAGFLETQLDAGLEELRLIFEAGE